MNLSLVIDFNQLKSLIAQCGIEEKNRNYSNVGEGYFSGAF